MAAIQSNHLSGNEMMAITDTAEVKKNYSARIIENVGLANILKVEKIDSERNTALHSVICRSMEEINSVRNSILYKRVCESVEDAGFDLERDSEITISPQLMGDRVVVRGKHPDGRGFIAVKVDLFNSAGTEKIAQVVEVIFQQYIDTSTNNVPTWGFRNSDGKSDVSMLSRHSRGISTFELKEFGKLLEGEKTHYSGYLHKMKMAESDS